MAEKVIMVLKVDDLQCSCCYKKVKKILCKFPREIRDQVYDEKANTVTITVVCCNPEKIRDKLYRKGCKVIKSIEIKEPPKPDPPKPNPDGETKQEKKDDPKPESDKKKPETGKPKSPCTCPRPCTGTCTGTCTCTYTWTCTCTYTCTCHGTCTGTCKHPKRKCCGGGPCYHGCGVPLLPQPCYDGYYVRRCDYYFSEDSPRDCSIM